MDSSGIITTVAGNGENASGDEGIPATEGSLSNPRGVFVDVWGNIFIADTGNHRLRKVEWSSGLIRTVAGSGDAPDYYYSFDDGVPAIEAKLVTPLAVFLDGKDRIIIGDSLIRMVDPVTGLIETIVGGGRGNFYQAEGLSATEAALGVVRGVFLDAVGNLYYSNNTAVVYKVAAIAPPYQEPGVYISPQSISVDGRPQDTVVNIRSLGLNQEWTIGEQQNWFGVTSSQGDTDGDGTFSGVGDVELTVSTSGIGLADGVYEGVIEIRSNGGDADITIRMEVGDSE